MFRNKEDLPSLYRITSKGQIMQIFKWCSIFILCCLLFLSHAVSSHALDGFEVSSGLLEQPKNPLLTKMKISKGIKNGWYIVKRWALLKEEPPNFQLFNLNIHGHYKDVAIYHKKENSQRFVKTGQVLADLTDIRSAHPVYGRKNDFYLIGVTKFAKQKREKRAKVWISQNAVMVITIQKYLGECRALHVDMINLKLLQPEKFQASLDFYNVVMAAHLEQMLNFWKNKYSANNCGLHALLASIVMMHPKKLKNMVERTELIAQLEDLSISDNQVRLQNTLRGLSGAVLFLAGYELKESILGPTLAAALAAGLITSKINPFFEFQELFRKMVGIMPEKLKDLGDACLKMFDLDEKQQIVLAKENNVDKLRADWKAILETGSPIIALLRKSSALSGHYVVIYGLSEKGEFYYWDINQRTGQNFIADEELEVSLDSYKNNSFKLTSLLAGVDARFNYLYFTLK